MDTWKKCAATGDRRGMEVEGVGGCESGDVVMAVEGERGRDEGGGWGEGRGGEGDEILFWEVVGGAVEEETLVLWGNMGAVEECKVPPNGASRESGNLGGLKSGRGGEVARSCAGKLVMPLGEVDEEGRGDGGRVGLPASGTDCEYTDEGMLH